LSEFWPTNFAGLSALRAFSEHQEAPVALQLFAVRQAGGEAKVAVTHVGDVDVRDPQKRKDALAREDEVCATTAELLLLTFSTADVIEDLKEYTLEEDLLEEDAMEEEKHLSFPKQATARWKAIVLRPISGAHQHFRWGSRLLSIVLYTGFGAHQCFPTTLAQGRMHSNALL
jgi:hypothetical protein